MLLVYIISALIISSAGSVSLAGSLLFLNEDRLDKISSWLLTLAGGTLLGAAFLGMLPKALQLGSKNETILAVTLIGILIFFIIEKIILLRTCGNKNCERHKNVSAPLILLGDALHNFIDGVIITAAFFSSYRFGIIVTISVFAHEVPQELADFGVLINNGYSKLKALKLNLISGLTAIPGGLLAYITLDWTTKLVPWILALSAASFTYIALADLVPQMHNKTNAKNSILQVIFIISGVLIIYCIKKI
jgi:zinc and cadmium transporter